MSTAADCLVYPQGMTMRRFTWRVALLVAGIVVLATFPLYLPVFLLGVFTSAFYLGTYAMAWDLLFGYGGDVNFGPTFLVGLGAYIAAMCNSLAGLPVWVCIVAGCIAAVIGGLLLAAPALRMHGPYFGIVTFVAVLILLLLIDSLVNITGGEIGLTVPDVLAETSATNYYAAFVLLLVSGALLRLIVASKIGLILRASGMDPVATEVLGFSVAKFKIFAFVVSAAISGVAGAMTIFYLGVAAPGSVVAIAVSVQIIIASIVGGRRTIIGSVCGGIFLILLSNYLRPIGTLSQSAVAGIALIVLLFTPAGIIGLLYARRGD